MRRRACHALALLAILGSFVVAFAEQRAAKPSNSAADLAIIIDDLGADLAEVDALASVPGPLTIAVLPGLSHSAAVAEQARRLGWEVLLHLPMAARSDGASATVGLRPGMEAAQVDATVEHMLATVPSAVGVSNHRGSRATADRPLMEALMAALHKRGLFLIDSRTTAATVAQVVAEHAGVKAAARKVFLDNVPERRAVLNQLDLAAGHARRTGAAIAIGHPHAATIGALRDGVARLRAQGVHLVVASAIVR
jgi:uncharacterized protein